MDSLNLCNNIRMKFKGITKNKIPLNMFFLFMILVLCPLCV